MPETDILRTEITYLKGVGPQRAATFNEGFEIYNFEDLLNFFPFRYLDKSNLNNISDIISDDEYYQIKGVIADVQVSGKGKGKRMSALFQDDHHNTITLRWFQGINWLEERITIGKSFLLFGKPNKFGSKFQFVHPEMNKLEDFETSRTGLYPVYHSSEKASSIGLNSRGIARLMENLFERIYTIIPENLSPELISRYKLMPRRDCLFQIHFPNSITSKDRAVARLKFEEFFFLQISYVKSKLYRKQKSIGHVFSKIGHNFNSFYSNYLPFELTNAQKRVIKEIRFDMGQPYQMNRLLQGDVGSGKTLVALMAMLIASDNDYQSALMAPTEILANQHFNTISKYLINLNIEVKLLTGSTPNSERKGLHENLKNGNLKILIGTHALIEDSVVFKKLGLVVIDEQHRFGVAQRAKLWSKNSIPPEVLVMTATPIPRTMAMTLYGDLDYSVIDELPVGRKPIITYHFNESKRLKVFDFMKKLIALGQQVYIVYPLIEESETLDLKNLMEGYEAISRSFPLPDYRLGIVHGKMDSQAKDIEMERFSKGISQILVSTTVIEVGVDVPNATLMIIENANRFGLSQLHQLRGRVGRGKEQSYCILMSEGHLTKDAKARLNTMVETTDGFVIANTDLKLRGPGDLSGTRQSGLIDFKFADIVQDEKILNAAKISAERILKVDPDLTDSSNLPIREFLIRRKSKANFDWSKIS